MISLGWVGFLFVLSLTSTVRAFAAGTLRAENVHGENCLCGDSEEGMHVSLRIFICQSLLVFLDLDLPVMQLKVGRSFHAFL